MNNKRAVTLVELLVSLGIISMVLLPPLYTFFTRSFKFGSVETKNIDSIQELTFIVNHLRNDLRTMIELPDIKDSTISFDPSTKTLKFMVVSGYTDTGMQVLSTAKYYFKNKELHKSYIGLNGNSIDKVLSKPGGISKFEFEIMDINGEKIGESRSDGRIPAYVRMMISHSCSNRLKIDTNVYLTYMRDLSDNIDNYRLSGWKIQTTSFYLMLLKTNIGNLLVDLRTLINMLSNVQMKIAENMSDPQLLQKTVIKHQKPVPGAKPGDPDPYVDPPPPPPPPPAAGPAGGPGGNPASGMADGPARIGGKNGWIKNGIFYPSGAGL